MPGTLFVVATPIGNLEDISARALRVLRHVAVIAAEDTRRTAHLLARYQIATPTTSLHEHNEARKMAGLLARLERGDDIALVSDAGMPVVSDPGEELVRAALDAGMKVEPVPGPSAVTAALAVSGLPARTFTFLGFPPIKITERQRWFEDLRTAGRTVVFFEAPHRVRSTLEQLGSVIGDTRVVVCREITKVHSQLVKGPISEILPELASPKGEFTVVVDIGHKTDITTTTAITDDSVLAEFGHLMKISGLSRRQIVNTLARKHGKGPNEIYAAIERAKKLGN